MEEDGIWGSETHSKDNKNTLMRTLPILRISLQSSTKKERERKEGSDALWEKALCIRKIMVLLSFQQIFKYSLSLCLINCRLQRTYFVTRLCSMNTTI